MKMEDRRTCLACGAEFSGAMKFCPVCILHQALDAQGDSCEPALEGPVEPASGPGLSALWASPTRRSMWICVVR